MTRKTYWQFSVPGMTLVEVVAAIAILGILLVSLTLSRSSHTHQLAEAKNLSDGAHLVDDLIASWWSSPGGVPLNSSGSTGPHEDWIWETHVVSNPSLDDLGAHVVRVEARQISAPAANPIIVDLVVNSAQKDQS